MASRTATAATADTPTICHRVARVLRPCRWAFIASWCPERPAATASDSSTHPSAQFAQAISWPVSRNSPRTAYAIVLTSVQRGAESVVAGLVPVQARTSAMVWRMRSRRRCSGMTGCRLAPPVPDVSRYAGPVAWPNAVSVPASSARSGTTSARCSRSGSGVSRSGSGFSVVMMCSWKAHAARRRRGGGHGREVVMDLGGAGLADMQFGLDPPRGRHPALGQVGGEVHLCGLAGHGSGPGCGCGSECGVRPGAGCGCARVRVHFAVRSRVRGRAGAGRAGAGRGHGHDGGWALAGASSPSRYRARVRRGARHRQAKRRRCPVGSVSAQQPVPLPAQRLGVGADLPQHHPAHQPGGGDRCQQPAATGGYDPSRSRRPGPAADPDHVRGDFHRDDPQGGEHARAQPGRTRCAGR